MPTVLVIDDYPLITDFVQLAVPKWRILSAMTGRKGLALLREHLADIDVIVLDMGLPGMDGRQVCARMREIAPITPIIPFTGDAFADDELHGLGCEPTVIKSAGRAVLANALNTAYSHAISPPPYADAPLLAMQVHAGAPVRANVETSGLAAPTLLDRRTRILAEIGRCGSCTITQLADVLGENAFALQGELKALTATGFVVATEYANDCRYHMPESPRP